MTRLASWQAGYRNRPYLALTFLFLAASLPFVNRAYFVDDYYFVTMAKGILEHPSRPYDFVSDDAGLGNVAWERGQQPRMVNPPLFHYFLAGVIRLWGEETWKLRTAALIFPLISLCAFFALGKRFVKNPLAAASLLAITPAFWLTSYSLLIDSALLAFFMASLVFFIEGHERKRLDWLVLSGFLMGCTLLTKYTGALILPVVLMWHELHRKQYSWTRTLAALSICVGIFVLWGYWGVLTYGQSHFMATFSRGFHTTTPLGLSCLWLNTFGIYVRWQRPGERIAMVLSWFCWGITAFFGIQMMLSNASIATWLNTFYFDKVLSVSSFLGGATVFLLFIPLFLWPRSVRGIVLFVCVNVLLFLGFISRYAGFEPIQAAMLSVFITSAVLFITLVLLNVPVDSKRPLKFLLAWLVMGILELILVMPWTAARYLLLLLPPVCWIFRRFVEESQRHLIWRWAWGTTAIMGLALAYVDYAQAGVVGSLTAILRQQEPVFERIAPRPISKWYYLADTFDGSQPYVLKEGWAPSFPDQDFNWGDLVLRSYYRKSAWWRIPHSERFEPLMAWEFKNPIPLRVMDIPASGGFYASVWGVLPYTITTHPLERFELAMVKGTIKPARPAANE